MPKSTKTTAIQSRSVSDPPVVPAERLVAGRGASRASSPSSVRGPSEGQDAEVLPRGPQVDREGCRSIGSRPPPARTTRSRCEEVETSPTVPSEEEQPRRSREQARNRRRRRGDDRPPDEALARARGPRRGLARGATSSTRRGRRRRRAGRPAPSSSRRNGEQSESAEANPGAPGAGLEKEGEGGGDGEQEPGLRIGAAQAVLEQQSGGRDQGGARSPSSRGCRGAARSRPSGRRAAAPPRPFTARRAAELVPPSCAHPGAVPPDDERRLPDEGVGAPRTRRPLTGMQRPAGDPDVERLVAEEGDVAQLVEEQEVQAARMASPSGGPKRPVWRS